MKKHTFAIFAVIALLAVSAVAYLYMPILAQPGDHSDPLVTRRYVDDRITELQEQIAVLQHLITGMPAGSIQFPAHQGSPGGLTAADRDALFHDIMLHFDLVYGELLRSAAAGVNRVPPFDAVHVPAGRTVILEGGTEVVLRSGTGRVVAGPNGLLDVTAGRDIGNGEDVSMNHKLIAPLTDGRGITFTTDSWIMIRGGRTIV